jgi:hypothetical protein
MKKVMPWLIAIILILAGFVFTIESFLAGLLSVLAGVTAMPPISKKLMSIKQLAFLSSIKRFPNAVIPAILVVSAFFIMSSAKDANVIAEYNKDPAKLVVQVKKDLEAKEFTLAKIHVEKYSDLLPNNPELKALLAEIDSAKVDAKRKEVEDKAQAEAKTANTNSTSSATEADSDLVAKCLGILSSQINVVGLENLSLGNKKYLANHQKTVQPILAMLQEKPECTKAGVDLNSCYSSYSPYQRSLMTSFNSAVEAYAEAKRVSPEKIKVYLASCTE